MPEYVILSNKVPFKVIDYNKERKMTDTKKKVDGSFYDRWSDDEDEDEVKCEVCDTTCMDHTSNKGRGSNSPCVECGENRCKHCSCECVENLKIPLLLPSNQ